MEEGACRIDHERAVHRAAAKQHREQHAAAIGQVDFNSAFLAGQAQSRARLVARKIDARCLEPGAVETNLAGARQKITVRQGIERANKTLRQVRSAWVKEQRVNVDRDGGIEFQANILVTFVLED